MSTAHFKVQEHVLPTSHIREYPRATAGDQEVVLNLAIKQYTPLDAKFEDEGDVTIIGGHANGFPKELYEPFWDDLYERLKARNIRIRSIWIADVSFQGQSGVLNEHELGNDPSWMDHPRDLFLMVNHFRKHMKRPIIGVGHSMGGNNLINLSLMHPRLFTSFVLMDPVIQKEATLAESFNVAVASTGRRDRWPSREAAKAAFKRSKFYQTWDPRVLDRWIEHGLRELPTPLYSDIQANSNTLPAISADPTTASVVPDKNSETEVTLKTTKHQEVFSFARPNFPTPEFPDPATKANPLTHPDIPETTGPVTPFYRPEPITTFAKLPALRPSVFYIFADKSDMSVPHMIADKMAATGVGVGGSGGVAKGRVAEVTFKDVGHLIPMEVTSQAADAAAEWIVPEIERFHRIEEAHREEWSKVPKKEKSVMSEKFKAVMLRDQPKSRGKSAKTKL